jgi:hypothetical protein
MENRYYKKPTQVMFKENEDGSDTPRWIGGIAYENIVICGECGHVVTYDLIDEIKELSWLDISETIGGDEIYSDC